MILPKGIPTLHAHSTGNFTCPDNVFASSSITELVLECNTHPEERPPKSDHIPIVLTLSISLEKIDESPKPNFRATD
jgi:hypothetical protein